MSENLVFKATDNINGGNEFRVFELDVAALPGTFILQSVKKSGVFECVSILLSRNEIEALRDALAASLAEQDFRDIQRLLD